MDRGAPLVETETMRARLRTAFAPVHLAGRVLGVAGALTLFLSTLGVFGVVALAVARRTHEIGIRRALGGTRSHVVALVVRDSLVLVGLALALGLAAALALNRTLGHYLYSVRPHDPLTLASTLLALGLVAALAGWWPARRATRVEPVVALRSR